VSQTAQLASSISARAVRECWEAPQDPNRRRVVRRA
jgi:hypothetical protein